VRITIRSECASQTPDSVATGDGNTTWQCEPGGDFAPSDVVWQDVARCEACTAANGQILYCCSLDLNLSFTTALPVSIALTPL
jgi:hypothetical protein